MSETTIKRIGAREARNHFAELLDQVRHSGDPVIIERSGKPVAAMIPIELYTQLQEQVEQQPVVVAQPSHLAEVPSIAEASPPYLVALPIYEPDSTSQEPFSSPKSLFGIFPELAALALEQQQEEGLDEIEALWQQSLEKQLRLLEGEE